MNSKKQVDLPVWTIQTCCLISSFSLLILTGAIAFEQEVPKTVYLGLAAFCTLTNGWMLRVPGAFAQTAIRVLEKLAN